MSLKVFLLILHFSFVAGTVHSVLINNLPEFLFLASYG